MTVSLHMPMPVVALRRPLTAHKSGRPHHPHGPLDCDEGRVLVRSTAALCGRPTPAHTRPPIATGQLPPLWHARKFSRNAHVVRGEVADARRVARGELIKARNAVAGRERRQSSHRPAVKGNRREHT